MPPRSLMRVDRPDDARCAYMVETKPESKPRPHAHPFFRAHISRLVLSSWVGMIVLLTLKAFHIRKRFVATHKNIKI